MSKKKISKRAVDGVFLLDKPKGMSSNAALQEVKHLFEACKAGHTGSLDPLASGMLPICLGEATKFSQFLLDAKKHYQVTVQLGVKTSTGDAEGEIINQAPVDNVTRARVEQVLTHFTGEIDQIPSMYSALKHKGQPLYKLARQGISVERKSRKVTIYEIQLLNHEHDTFEFEVHCSKGTYVRTLVEDIGDMLGCGAYVKELRRLVVGSYQAEQMKTLDEIKELSEKTQSLQALDECLLPIDSSVANLPTLNISAAAAFYLIRGQAIIIPRAPNDGWVNLKLQNGGFLGVGEILGDGRVAPRRLVQQRS